MINLEPQHTVITVNYNSSKFVDILLEGVNRLAELSCRIIVADNGSRDEDFRYLVWIAKKWNNVLILPRWQNEPPSFAHAIALEHMLQFVETPYVTILDADATFLLRGWDRKLRERMTDNTCVIGSPLCIDPNSTTNKHIDFPFMFAAMYRTSLLRGIRNPFLPTPGRGQMGEDTGWRIREYCRSNGLQGITFEGRNTRTYKGGPLGAAVCAEYYLDGELVASHFGRGSSQGEAKYFKKLPTIPLISQQIRRWKGRCEAHIWQEHCRKIIEYQAAKCDG